MEKELTFNDHPQVVAELRNEVIGMRQMLGSLQRENAQRKENTHRPTSVEEAAEYLKIPQRTLYQKLGDGTIPATKPGKRYVLYQDELDKWLEYNRKNPVPLTPEELNAAIIGGNRRKPVKECQMQSQFVNLRRNQNYNKSRLSGRNRKSIKPIHKTPSSSYHGCKPTLQNYHYDER